MFITSRLHDFIPINVLFLAVLFSYYFGRIGKRLRNLLFLITFKLPVIIRVRSLSMIFNRAK